MPEVTPNSIYQFKLADSLLEAQMLFVAFGALVLVPLLTNFDSDIALFTASLAFIAPILCGAQTWGFPAALCGLCAAGLVYSLVSLAIHSRSQIIQRLLPPVVTGPVIMVVELVLPQARKCLLVYRAGLGSRRKLHEEILPLEQCVLATRLNNFTI